MPSNYTLHLGDCLEVMPRMPANSVDAIVADWPYDSIDAKWDNIIPLDLLWEQCKRVLKLNGVIVLTAQDEFSAVLLLSNRGDYRHKWIWIKDKCGNFLAAQGMPLKVTEDILVFSRCGFAINANNRATYNPQMVKSEKYQKPFKRTKRYESSDVGRNTHLKANRKWKKTEESKAYYASYYLRHKNKNRARGRVFDAVRSGRMPPATALSCVHCGNQAIEYHHHKGYSDERSFDVIPLCKPCHIKAEKGQPISS